MILNIQLYNFAISDIENETLQQESENDWESSISRDDLKKFKQQV